uniref:Uncharacterized protein n=1 Tax=Solanum tuberosum TaxID=4113 RepID=M1DJH1_SOLTU
MIQVKIGIMINPSARIRGSAGIVPTSAYVTHRGYCGHSILGFFQQLPVSSHIGLVLLPIAHASVRGRTSNIVALKRIGLSNPKDLSINYSY